MKRWQDRGEVEDSEGDEDLSLDTDSPSPERPHKIAKYSQGNRVENTTPNPRDASEDEEESNWIQAKVAKTYGRRGRTMKQTSASASRHQTPDRAVAVAQPGPSLAKDGAVNLTDADLPRLSRESSLDNNIDGTSIDQDISATEPTGDSHIGVALVSESSQDTRIRSSQADGANLITWAPSSTEHITQPQLSASALLKRSQRHNLLADQKEHDECATRVGITDLPQPPGPAYDDLPEPTLPAPQNDDFLRLSELLSSPLSERDVSPPLDFFPRRLESLPRGNDMVALDEAESLSPNVDGLDIQPHVSAANARRSLRARQEKQLHPYMYDKAQYQKQFRERGLRPVRVIEQDTPNEETQSASHSATSQSSDAIAVSSPPESQPAPQPDKAHPQLDYFDLVDGSSDDELGDHRPAKRRKIDAVERRRPGQLPAISSAARLRGRSVAAQQNSAPPSPPRTSSDIETPNMFARGSRHVVSGFRLPGGRVPAALPTPQISSDVRPQNFDIDAPADSPTRMLQSARRGSDTLSSDSSSSESENDAIAEAEAKRLRREQKRIKGVLPASWLRIDFRKQRLPISASPAGRRDFNAQPSPRTEPQKGVARKLITNRPRQKDSPGLDAIADGDSEDSDVSLREFSVNPKQARLAFEDQRLSIDANEAAVDDEEMEDDSVDAMLAGMSRSRGKARKANQPRITDAFRKSSGPREDHNRDHVPGQRDYRSAVAPGFRQRRRRRQAGPRPSPPHLSIVDAPRSSPTGNRVPQFVRLAMRRARNVPSRGRHSPTDKVLRLATADDTEEASSVLRAWREGTIAARPPQSPDRLDALSTRRQANAMEGDRVPLANLPANAYQPRIQATRPRKPVVSMTQPRQGPTRRLGRPRNESSADDQRATDQEPLDRRLDPVIPRRRQAYQHSRVRSAQLETLETEFDQTHRAAAFRRRMQVLAESTALPEHRFAPGLQLTRFLHTTDENTSSVDVHDAGTQAAASAPAIPILPHRPRKSLARRLDIGTRQYRQPSEPLPDISAADDPQQTGTDTSKPVLEGLGPFGTRYSKDFDIEALDLGTFFQHTTFIGSGELNDAFSLAKRDLTCAAGRMRVQLGNEMVEWGAWNEDVAASFKRIPTVISEALQTLETADLTYDRDQQLSAVDSNIDYLLRSVSRFCSKCLYFVDAVDRQPCAESLYRLVVDLADTLSEPAAATEPLPKTRTKVLQYELVIIKQASQIGNHHNVSAATRTQIENQLSLTSKRLANMAVIGHCDELRSFYEDNKDSEKRGAGVDGNAHAFSSVVILNNAMPASGLKSLFWESICSTMGLDIDQTCAIGRIDKLWYDLFSLLPALEMTSTGTVCVGGRLMQPRENWRLPQAILSRVFELYESSSEVRGYSVNDYVRALLSRCYTLVNKWGWWRCESVLNVIYDFFSRRGLALLKKEDSRGSPKFLDQLGSSLVELDVQNDDRSFHIFLKILASGLIGIRKYQLYGDRKIQGIAWRFIPNHNRSYRKDADVERSTLDALRNHHDLVCTLYYASPPGHRPGVHLLRELVDHTTSHREACRLNVKSWANIASFQASTTETLDALRPLTSWYADIMKTTIAQYRLAKFEAQQAFDQAKIEGANPSEALLDSTVTNNQRQLAATIVDALAGLKRALISASSSSIAVFLAEETAFWTVFELFDPSQRRLISAMTEALHVVETALDVEQRASLTHESQHSSDDSQDFGDSDALQEFAAHDASASDSVSIVDILLGPVGHLISNALGADVAPDDQLLQTSIDLWVRLAASTVKNAKKTWLDYVNDYSATGWGQMRDTVQKRKFTTYFMSRVIEHSTMHTDISHHVTTAWLLSLVEREALLKFQHTLTSALLTHLGHDRLLQNLPFARDSKGEYHITLPELRQGRLAAISSVLCNMRETHESAGPGKPADAIRMVHEGMLRQLMQAMKRNYRELQTTHVGAVADASVQGAYVDFVQQVVSFLQQHATRLCKVDGFFTDSTMFPLPSDDPTYVVGRLKGYVPHLSKPKTRKELAIFIQSVSERAAVDGQQPYLVNQMSTAMRCVTEHGQMDSPSLRYLLLTTVFPAYLGHAFTTTCSWVLVLPVLQACEQVIPDLAYCVVIEDERSVMAAAESVIAIVHGINQQLEKALNGFPGMLGFSHVLRTLSAMILVGTSTLSFASLIKRSTSHGGELIKQLQALSELAVELRGRLENSSEVGVFEASIVADNADSPWPDTRAYADTQLRDDMHFWQAEEGRYYLKKYNRTQEAVVSLRSSEEEGTNLLRAIHDFQRAHDATFSMRGRSGTSDANSNGWMDDIVV